VSNADEDADEGGEMGMGGRLLMIYI
jgi:hypothetical protein